MKLHFIDQEIQNELTTVLNSKNQMDYWDCSFDGKWSCQNIKTGVEFSVVILEFKKENKNYLYINSSLIDDYCRMHGILELDVNNYIDNKIINRSLWKQARIDYPNCINSTMHVKGKLLKNSKGFVLSFYFDQSDIKGACDLKESDIPNLYSEIMFSRA